MFSYFHSTLHFDVILPNRLGELGGTSSSFILLRRRVAGDRIAGFARCLQGILRGRRGGYGDWRRAEQEAEDWEAQLRLSEERIRAERRDADRMKNRQGPLRPPFYSHSSSSLFSPGLHHSLPPANQNHLPSSHSLPCFRTTLPSPLSPPQRQLSLYSLCITSSLLLRSARSSRPSSSLHRSHPSLQMHPCPCQIQRQHG